MQEEIKEIEIQVSINQDINEASFILAPKSAENMNEIYAANLEEKIKNEIKLYKEDVNCALDIVRNSEEKINEFELIVEESKIQCKSAKENSQSALDIANSCSNQDLSNLSEEGQAKFDEKVSKTGDTISGYLYVEDGFIYNKGVNNQIDITTTTTPSSTLNGGNFSLRDMNNQVSGQLMSQLDTYGYLRTIMGVRRNIDGTIKVASISVGLDKDGNIATYCPTPAKTDNSSKIATTAFVRSAAVGYPDYTKGVSKSNNTEYTADKNGQLIVVIGLGWEFKFTYNETTITYPPNVNAQGWKCIFTFLIPKGAKYKVYTSSGFESATFYPMT